ncbi:hypothetical protein NDU88_004659 [Pleurodeles waltl]|uniref:Uncharacterized protein n=1 Tax=Pleurodeles waltl TaxID=8319 RepID=A0AAV7UFT7_PLEWA|nr:hypothetical protein NDU88_004659 [Pleurodeles waltl]
MGQPQRLKGPRPHLSAAPPFRFQGRVPRASTGCPSTSGAAGRPGRGPSRLRAVRPRSAAAHPATRGRGSDHGGPSPSGQSDPSQELLPEL